MPKKTARTTKRATTNVPQAKSAARKSRATTTATKKGAAKRKAVAAKKRVGKPPPTARAKNRAAPASARAKPPSANAASTGDEAFWQLIGRVESKSRGELSAACTTFRAELEALTDGELRAAVVSFNDAMRRAHNFDVWGAAYLVHGGCSDDGFWDFRAGLVALGRAVYETALQQPDSLAAIDDIEDRTIFGGFQSIPRQVLEARGLSVETLGQHARPVPGTAWDDDAELETRYPRLAARFA